MKHLLLLSTLFWVILSFAGDKIGIYNGTFDPIHKGHIANIKSAIDGMNLDKVYIAPIVAPGGKSPTLTFEQRWSLVKLAIENKVELILPDKEILLKHTLEKNTHHAFIDFIKAQESLDATTMHIIGADTYLREDLQKYFIKEAQNIPNHEFIIMNRDGYDLINKPNGLEDKFHFVQQIYGPTDMSSSKFRKDPKGNLHRLPKPVQEAINKNNFYNIKGCNDSFSSL